MTKIIECVPNFSEGKNIRIIKEITAAAESVKGVVLLNVDRGEDANRTVVTFAGDPDSVSEAAFRAIKRASELIDMSLHKGVHPRFGATDVCPLIPLSGITMEETVEYARKLAEKTGNELKIPVYCYEYAAFSEQRKSLANCRSGGYEGLKEKIASEKWKPDFGPDIWSERIAKTGATAIGARKILIAYNINLNTKSANIAKSIASKVRESGNGGLKNVKAIGWYIEEYGKAQVSMNLTDISVTPVHVVFEEVCKKAEEHGVSVTGSELVGLIPLQSMIDAGKYYLQKQNIPGQYFEEELIDKAIEYLGLDELSPFKPRDKIIEHLYYARTGKKLKIRI